MGVFKRKATLKTATLRDDVIDVRGCSSWHVIPAVSSLSLSLSLFLSIGRRIWWATKLPWLHRQQQYSSNT